MREENITHKEGNKPLVRITWMTEDKNIKIAIITTFDMFKKVKKSLSMLTRNRKYIKRPKLNISRR